MRSRVVNDCGIRNESKPGLFESELESGSNDAGIGIRIKSFGKHWNRNQNWNHLLLEPELESESLILLNLQIGIRIGISPSGIGIGIRTIQIAILESDLYVNHMSYVEWGISLKSLFLHHNCY